MNNVLERQLIARCRNLLHEYEAVLTAIQDEIESVEDSSPLSLKSDSEFDIARKAIRRDAVKEGIKLFIGRIKHYGSQNPNQ